MKLADDEAPVLRGALDLLKLYRKPAFRVNSGSIKTVTGWVTLAPEGTADICGWLPGSGRFLGLEIKRPRGGVLRPAQLAFLEQLRRDGGVGVHIDDLERLKKVLNQLDRDPFARFTITGERDA